jgi:OOP family OmpA-OmpF porin
MGYLAPLMKNHRTQYVIAFIGMAFTSLAIAQTSDIKGGKDHPLIQRFQGSWLTGYAQIDWTETQLPAASNARQDGKSLERLQRLEGRETRLHYLSPLGKTPLEVQRNYQQALSGAGMKIALQCEQQCKALYSQWIKQAKPFERQFQWHSGTIGAFSHADAPDANEGRMLVGSIPGNAGRGNLDVLIYSSAAVGGDPKVGQRTSTFIQIIEGKAMPSGQVTINADALNQGLRSQGRIALYGLFFDTGKAELKAESRPQLDEMLASLKAQPQQKVIIVGHTDNVGAIDANLSLSQARAQAVLNALVQGGIEGKRLQARGVANFAPLAANDNEEGRARNRRVEMVLQ